MEFYFFALVQTGIYHFNWIQPHYLYSKESQTKHNLKWLFIHLQKLMKQALIFWINIFSGVSILYSDAEIKENTQ